jgi:shikimate kinase
VSIPTIFDIEGEVGFRRREHAVLAELARLRDAVIATGGGAVLDPENRRLMRENGTVIYLNVSLEHLHHRTARDMNRPLLAQSADRRATLSALLSARDPLYREAAHCVIEGGAESASALASRIAEMLERPGQRRAPSGECSP